MIKITLIGSRSILMTCTVSPAPYLLNLIERINIAPAAECQRQISYDVNMDVVCERQDTATHG